MGAHRHPGERALGPAEWETKLAQPEAPPDPDRADGPDTNREPAEEPVRFLTLLLHVLSAWHA
jgi:hypothetical protein